MLEIVAFLDHMVDNSFLFGYAETVPRHIRTGAKAG
jgi:hypothetical protein